MKLFIRAVCALILIAGITGCGKKGKGPAQDGDSIYLESVRLTYELADACENEADSAKIEEINQRITENEDQMMALPESERTRLDKKYRGEMMNASKRIVDVSSKHPVARIGKHEMPNFIGMKRKMEAMKGNMPGKGFGEGTGGDAGRK
jgi:hypothetical protein